MPYSIDDDPRLVSDLRGTIRQNDFKLTWFADGSAMLTIRPTLGGVTVDMHGHIQEFAAFAEQIVQVAKEMEDG